MEAGRFDFMIKRWLALTAAALTMFLCAGVTVNAEDAEGIFTYTLEPLYAPLSTGEKLPPHLSSTNLSDTETAVEPMEYDEAVAFMREALLNREEQVTLRFFTTQEEAQTKLNELYDRVLVHGADPAGGDYLRFMTDVYPVGNITGSSVNGSFSVTGTFAMNYYTTAEEEAFVDAEVEKLVAEWSAMNLNDYQTIRTIYDYIVETVEYDHDHLTDTSYKHQFTAYAALHDKTAVCQGYASLFYRLALEMGIDARMISGQQINHAWNIAELDGIYYNFDATWDDTTKSNPYRYFFKGSAAFGDHPCDGQFLTEEFITAYPISETDYTGVTGDVSGDGVLDENDVLLLNQYFAGWPVVVNANVGDFNNDGEMNRRDAMLLARTVDGWPADVLTH